MVLNAGGGVGGTILPQETLGDVWDTSGGHTGRCYWHLVGRAWHAAKCAAMPRPAPPPFQQRINDLGQNANSATAEKPRTNVKATIKPMTQMQKLRLKQGRRPFKWQKWAQTPGSLRPVLFLSACVPLHSRRLAAQKPQTDPTGGAVTKPGRCPGDKDVGPGRTTTPVLGQGAFPPNSTEQWEAMPEAGGRQTAAGGKQPSRHAGKDVWTGTAPSPRPPPPPALGN